MPLKDKYCNVASFTDAPLVSVSPAAHSYVEGDTVDLTCATDAEPAASVLWYRAGSGHIVARQPLLRLAGVTREQAGEYVCSANNSVGTSQPDTVNIAVQCKWLPPVKTFMLELQTTSYFPFLPKSQGDGSSREIKIKFLYIFPWAGESKHRLIPWGL